MSAAIDDGATPPKDLTPASTAPPKASPEGAPTPFEVVFVVDDDDAMRDSLEFLLSSIGLETRSFASAAAFLDAYDPSQGGCLLTDVQMPGQSGLELYAELRRRGWDIPVVVMTAHGDVPMAVRAMRDGVSDFIEKPFSDDALLACLLRAMRSRQGNDVKAEAAAWEAHYPPRQIGHYRIVRSIGRGGMGEVFLAEDTELDRQVALKVLHLHVASADASPLRFRREARMIASLNHPNIVTIHQIIEGRDYHCIVMEWVEGQTVRQLIDQGEIRSDDAIVIAMQLCDALTEAHRIGVIHRDVKPENIIIDVNGRARLLDFGIAYHEESERLTGENKNLGTPAYMSPEQCIGEGVSPFSDQFGVGVVLYEMLLGTYPFKGRHEYRNPLLILKSIVADAPEPFPPETVASLPGPLPAIVMRCLEKLPEMRYPNVEALRAELAACHDESTSSSTHLTPVVRVPESAPALTTASLDGLPRSFGWVTFGIFVMLIAGAFWLWTQTETDSAVQSSGGQDSTIAVLPFSVRGADHLEYLEDGLVELLSLKIDDAGAIRSVDPRALLRHYSRYEGSPEHLTGQAVAERFEARYFTEGNLFLVGRDLHLDVALFAVDDLDRPLIRASGMGSPDDLLTVLDDVTVTLLKQLAGELAMQLRPTGETASSSLPAIKAFLRGEERFREGRYEDALVALQEAVAEDPSFALAHYRLCAVADWLARGDISERAAREAERLSDRLTDRDRQLLLALIAWRRGDATRAERIYRSLLGTYDDDAESWFRLGEVLFHYGPRFGRDLQEAQRPFEAALALDPTHIPTLWHLTRIASREGQDELLADYAERIRTLQPDGERLLEIHSLEAFSRGGEAQREESLKALHGATDLTLLISLWNVATFSEEDSRSVLDNAVQLADALVAPSRSSEMRTLGRVSKAHLSAASGRFDGAFSHLQEAAKEAPFVAAEHRALLLLHPSYGASREALAASRETLQALSSDGVDNDSPNVFFAVHNGLHEVLRAYLVGRLSLRLDDLTTARDRVDSLRAVSLDDTVATSDGGAALANDLARELEARLALAQGDPDTAVGLLQDIQRTHVWYGWATVSPFFSRTASRYLLAEVLAEQGQVGAALALLDSFDEHSIYDLVYLAPALELRAKIYESTERGELAELERAAVDQLVGGPP